MAYLAPEVFHGGGYLSNVDWWSLGVTFYECIYSKRPFDGRSHNSLSEAIMRTQPKYYVTNPAVTVPCLHALSALLEKDPTKRIGAMSFESFTSHAFFAPIDFEALQKKEIEPVFVPSSDKTNFDATYDLEELLLEEAPLEARARRQKPRAELKDDATAKEIREDELHRIIETMFEPFDYTTMNYETTAAAAIAASANPEDCLNLTTSPSQRRRRRHTNSQGRSGSSSPSVRTDRSTRTDKSVKTEKSCRSTTSDHGHGQNNVPVDSANQGSPPSDRGGALSRSPPTQPPPGPSPLSTQRHTNRSHTITSTNQGVPQFLPPQPPPAQQPQPRGATRNRSKSGGVQMVLEETGSWSGLADQTANGDTLLSNTNSNYLPNGNGASISVPGNTSGGMFSFFSRKKGRERSPKPSERGVLGKEGARVVISG